MTNPRFPLRRVFLFTLCWVSFPPKLYLSSNHIVSTLVQVLLHVIFMSNYENFVLTLSWDKYVVIWIFCWKLKYSFVLVKHLCWKNIALWDINHVEIHTFRSPKYYLRKNPVNVTLGWSLFTLFNEPLFWINAFSSYALRDYLIKIVLVACHFKNYPVTI